MNSNMEKERRALFHHLRREIHDDRVLQAMEDVPRELFVSPEIREHAYKDVALQIAEGQTISQPFIVAAMTSALELGGGENVLELGTGSGYQAAVLSLLVPDGSLLTIERIPSLAESAVVRLRDRGYYNVEVRVAGDVLGCPEEAPYDAIIVTAATPNLPPSLLAQMALGGRMVLPIGTLQEQELVRVVRTGEGHTISMMGPCRFVPLIGPNAWPEKHGEL